MKLSTGLIILVIVGVLVLALLLFVNFRGTPEQSSEQKVGAGTGQEVGLGKEAPEITFTTLDGEEISLSDFRGNPVMLWLIATWCLTCQVGAKVLSEEKMSDIEKYDLKIIVLKLWNNLGYSGPSLEEFGREWVGENFNNDNWIWAEADRETSFLYDPRGLPDIYYLIDKEGVIRAIDTAPSATLNKIFNFAAQ